MAEPTSEELLAQWSSVTRDFSGLTGEELKEQWNLLISARDDILKELQKRDLYPSTEMNTWELETGAYPSQDDPEFLQKLLSKREFAESLQTSWVPKYDACGDVEQFEVTPVQRFVSNLMSPRTPYMSALLYHGVGVGKTCSAIQIAEAWLEEYPTQEVFIITPPTIREGFERTIFDMQRLKIPADETAPNTIIGCTGTRYLDLTGTVYERDKSKIAMRVKRQINKRYNIMGYLSFANYIKGLFEPIRKSLDPARYEMEKAKKVREHFNGKLVIVDEAHNLRDLPGEVSDSEVGAPGGEAEKADAAAGKILTPFLRDVVTYSDGMKLVLMTATPMYDNYREIIFMLNLLLANDKKALLSESKVFDKDGNIKPIGETLLAAAAMRYISYMRGENPKSFPIRLNPQGISKLSRASYPMSNPRGGAIADADKIFVDRLPITPIKLKGDALDVSKKFMEALPAGIGGISSTQMTQIVQAGNFVVPAEEGTDYKLRVGDTGLSLAFTEEMFEKERRYRAEDAKWLGVGQIGRYSPKFEFLLNRLKTAEGVAFVYTRFVKGCALPLALALEANGYSLYGRKKGLLANGIQTEGGRQCALCPKREKEHTGIEVDHFKPAYYGLLTGDITLSPHNDITIKAERNLENVEGVQMKVIIGSQIASEGVDLRFIRESHILDSWYHLSKIEQIVGRSIRFCSHSALPEEKRNTTVYLYAATYPEDISKETADLYSYRTAFKKARQVGRITRILKQHAIDCNLNHDAIIIQGQNTVRQIDAQRVERATVNINDQPFTALCDWAEDCDYKCLPTIKVSVEGSDDSSYDEYAARWRMIKLKDELRQRFSEQAAFSVEQMSELIEAPTAIRNLLLLETVNNKSFQVTFNGKSGYIRYCNGYYVFQPNAFFDLEIPLSIRMARFPVKRDSFTPIDVEMENVVVMPEEAPVESEDKLIAMWSATVEWVTEMSETPAAVNIPEELVARIEEIAADDRKMMDRLNQVLAMIRRFQITVHAYPEASKKTFKRIVLEYIWDNWLTLDQQIAISQNTELASDKENWYTTEEGNIVRRFFKADTKEIVFMCGTEPCTPAQIEAVTSDTDDEINKLVVDDTTTGDVVEAPDAYGKLKPFELNYGFMTSKKGNVVFKTNIAPMEGIAVGRAGKECSIVSSIGAPIQMLINLGYYMKSNGLPELQLSEARLKESRSDETYGSMKVENAMRTCTLMELVLRYMDVKRIGEKRWFYRPVAAFYAGHIGK